MLVQCPTCQHTHKSNSKRKRWHCTECGTLWDGTGRVVTGRKFPKPQPTAAVREKARAAKQQKQETSGGSARERHTSEQKSTAKKKRFWEAEIL